MLKNITKYFFNLKNYNIKYPLIRTILIQTNKIKKSILIVNAPILAIENMYSLIIKFDTYKSNLGLQKKSI